MNLADRSILTKHITSYPEAFRRAASAHAYQIAIESHADAITYAELNRYTDFLAALLVDRVEGRPVAICFRKSIECYISQIAVLKAGGFFVPIDPNYPQDRIDLMVDDSGATMVLCSAETKGIIEHDTMVIDLEELRHRAVQPTKPLPKIDPEQIAYMIYTSGSTGRPKGVPIHHAAMLNHNFWFIDEFNITEDDHLSQFASVSFDISVEEIFPTFLAGATLAIPTEAARQTSKGFIDFVRQHGLTVLNIPTAFWHELVHTLGTHPLPDSVRIALVGGEAACPSRVEQWFDTAPEQIQLVNAYGPTETTITSSIAYLRKGQEITIGKPVSGLEYHVWDEARRSVSDGSPGELVISGVGLSHGYWNRPDITARAFVTKGDTRYYRTGDKVARNGAGDYRFIGRIDDQVKIRGYRIEPGEVASAIASHSSVAECVVRAMDVHGTQQLVAYLKPRIRVDEPGDRDDLLKAHLCEKLPAYMVPDHFLWINYFPQTAGGKLDYQKLPQPAADVSTPEVACPPQSDTEAKLATIWQNVLGQPVTSVAQDFFLMGGNSLKAMRLVGEIEQLFPGTVVPIATLLQHTTIKSLAEHLDQAQPLHKKETPPSAPLITTINPDSQETPIVAFHGAGGGGLFFKDFESCLTERHPFHIIESQVLYQTGDIELPHNSVEELSEAYATALLPLLARAESVILSGYSLGGLLAYEVGFHLEQHGIPTQKLINIDAPVPNAVFNRPACNQIAFLAKLGVTQPNNLIKRIQNRFKLKRQLRQIDASEDSLSGELRSIALEQFYNEMENSYQPTPWSVDMHLIASSEEEIGTYRAPSFGWSQLVRDLEIESVPGSHLSMISEPHLPACLAAFRQAIEETTPRTAT